MSKNLLDAEQEINDVIKYINNNNEHVNSIEINEHTLNNLKSKGIYGFSDAFNKNIPIIINNFIPYGEIKFNREKNVKATEYVPYKIVIEYEGATDIFINLLKENEQLKKELAVLRMSEEEWLDQTIGREDYE